jgi:hypothetical protein
MTYAKDRTMFGYNYNNNWIPWTKTVSISQFLESEALMGWLKANFLQVNIVGPTCAAIDFKLNGGEAGGFDTPLGSIS